MGADFEVLRIFGQDFFSVARHDTAGQMIEKICRRYIGKYRMICCSVPSGCIYIVKKHVNGCRMRCIANYNFPRDSCDRRARAMTPQGAGEGRWRPAIMTAKPLSTKVPRALA